MAAPCIATETALQDGTAGVSLISVTKASGCSIQCLMAADSTVMDLLDAVKQQDKSGNVVDKVHAGLLEAVFLTENGIVMDKGLKLSEYDLGTDSTVTLVTKRKTQGCYCCWMDLDHSRLPYVERAKFTLEIKEQSVSINGVEGCFDVVDGDKDENGERFSVKFSRELLIRSELPNSKAHFRATGCEFTLRSCDYSQPWWFPVQGKLLGELRGTSARSGGSFKGRFRQDADL